MRAPNKIEKRLLAKFSTVGKTPRFELKTRTAGQEAQRQKRREKRDAAIKAGTLKQKPTNAEPRPTPPAPEPASVRDRLLRKDGTPRKRPKKNSSDAGQSGVGSRA